MYRLAHKASTTITRMPAGLGTLFAGLLLIVLAFVEGASVWKAMHEILFGLFGCGSFVLGAAVCYLAILYTRGQDLLMQVFKLLLGLIFASGTCKQRTIPRRRDHAMGMVLSGTLLFQEKKPVHTLISG